MTQLVFDVPDRIAKSSAAGRANLRKGPKRKKTAKTSLAKAGTLLPGVSPERLRKVAVLEKGLRRLEKAIGRGGAYDANRGALAATLLQQKLAATEELAAARRDQISSQKRVIGSGVPASAGGVGDDQQLRALFTGDYTHLSPVPEQTMTSGQLQGQSDYDRILAATKALGEARKSGDPLAVDAASQDLTLARLAAAHRRGIV